MVSPVGMEGNIYSTIYIKKINLADIVNTGAKKPEVRVQRVFTGIKSLIPEAVRVFVHAVVFVYPL